MASSTFEVKESESDSEKVLDFGLDTCEENGIMSPPVDGELPKDHTYTKEPDVLEEEDLKENDSAINQLEDNMDNNDPQAEKPKASKPVKVEKPTKRNAARGKSKKTAVKKEAPSPKKSKTKKDDVIADIAAVTEDLPKDVEKEESPAVEENDAPAEEPSKPAKEHSKPARRGRKRKVEEKENLLEENSTEEPVADVVEPPKKRNASAAKGTKTDKLPKKSLPSDGTVDHHNLPKGWVRKTVVRKTGKSAGQIDVYIYSPDGFKFRSKPDIAAYLHRTKSTLKLDHFDFSKKSVLQNSPVKATPAAKIPKKKAAPIKSKPPAAKKKVAASPKKTPKLLVKIVSPMRKKKVTKKTPAKDVKASKTPVKGKKTAKAAAKDTKKKKNA